MDLNKHIVTNDDSKPFHSNGYAQIAVGNRVGSTASHISFNQRQQVDRNRRIVYGYNRSVIGNNTYGISRTNHNLANKINIDIVRPQQSQCQNRANSTPNPPHQHYNPYA